MDKAKPFDIPKREVWEAYKRVKTNQGAAGVDGQSIEQFEQDLENNLYRHFYCERCADTPTANGCYSISSVGSKHP
jgi:hypothetical protein